MQPKITPTDKKANLGPKTFVITNEIIPPIGRDNKRSVLSTVDPSPSKPKRCTAIQPTFGKLRVYSSYPGFSGVTPAVLSFHTECA